MGTETQLGSSDVWHSCSYQDDDGTRYRVKGKKWGWLYRILTDQVDPFSLLASTYACITLIEPAFGYPHRKG
jgi:hypothetical protein